jgi:hypothetical protein
VSVGFQYGQYGIIIGLVLLLYNIILVWYNVALVSRNGIAVFDALVTCKLTGRKPLYVSTGRGVTDPLTGAGFSVTIST